MEINPDSYLKIHKVKTVVPLNNEQIFERVVRALWRQGGPCIKVTDSSGVRSPKTFAPRFGASFKSPCLTLLTPDDFRIAQKSIGYELLQNMKIHDPGWVQASGNNAEAVAKLKAMLADRGVDAAGFVFLTGLEDRAFRWALSMISLEDYDSPASKKMVLNRLHELMGEVCRTFGFSEATKSVLSFWTP